MVLCTLIWAPHHGTEAKTASHNVPSKIFERIVGSCVEDAAVLVKKWLSNHPPDSGTEVDRAGIDGVVDPCLVQCVGPAAEANAADAANDERSPRLDDVSRSANRNLCIQRILISAV